MEHQRVVEELHKSARRNYPRRKFLHRGIDETWQADLVDMQTHSKNNKGYNYILTVIDTFSKFAFAVPVKKKTGKDIAQAMESILKQGRMPKNLQVDNGKEFYNIIFQNLMSKRKINMYSTYSNMKASIVERFNRTLKNLMYKKFTLKGNKWLDILSDLISFYNNKKHRTINEKPINVTKNKEKEILRRITTDSRVFTKPKFKVGDSVRISKSKHVFEKGYTPNWTTEIFIVKSILKTEPVTYQLQDINNQVVKGCFYEQELQKTLYPDTYLVEKILKNYRILIDCMFE